MKQPTQNHGFHSHEKVQNEVKERRNEKGEEKKTMEIGSIRYALSKKHELSGRVFKVK